ncbi:MAG TPA: hypothetical protein VF187_00205, partial [Gemmatimonadales bacterium]
SALALRIRQEGDFRYTTTFIGNDGRELGRAGGLAPRFVLDRKRARNVTYVRARVQDSGGSVAWVQPVFVLR